jgi:hypothetical protein
VINNLHQASTASVLDLFQLHQKKYGNAYVQPLKVQLQDILNCKCEITLDALRLRIERLHEKYFGMWSKPRAFMAEEVQNGILRKECRYIPSRGYVVKDVLSPATNSVGPEEEEKKVVELPSNLRRAGEALARGLKRALKEGYISAELDVDTPDFEIYIATKVITLPAEEGKLPENSFLLRGNWAIFRRKRTRDHQICYDLDALWVNNGRKDLEHLDILTAAALQLHKYGEVAVTYQSRKGSTKQMMKNYGYRWSAQVNKDGQTIGLHCVKGEIAAAEEAVAACLMTRIVDLLVRPVLGMYVLRTITKTLEDGGNIWSTRYPFTVNSMTVDYENAPHKDTDDDDDGGIIVWLHGLEKRGSIKGGYFSLSTHGVHAEPQHGTVLYLRTSEVQHQSVAPTEGGGQVGIAFAVKKSMLTRFDQLQANSEDVESDNVDKITNKTVVSKDDISTFWRCLPGMKIFLERFIDKKEALNKYCNSVDRLNSRRC